MNRFTEVVVASLRRQKISSLFLWCGFVCSLPFSGWSFADSGAEPAKEASAPANPAVSKKGPDGLQDELVVTRHRSKIGDQEIEYTTTAGTLVVRSDSADAKARASIFFVAYTREGTKDLGRRPISFCFNGGPGSSSVWLHLGMLGPRRVPIREDAVPSKPPYDLVPNAESLLDQTDLVFIDPVSTGYSRPAKGEDKRQFHGFDEDIQSVGQFIHLYTTRYNRWQSPRFLIGESYGTLRAAGLSAHLLERYNMDLNGIVLVSSILDLATIGFNKNNDLPYVLFLPTYTATAWYHEKLAPELQADFGKTLKRSRDFAMGEYSRALFIGDALMGEQRQKMIKQLVYFTGLPADFIDRHDLRVDSYAFAKNLLHEKQKVIGRFDSRFVGIDPNPAGSRAGYDPSGVAIFAPYTATLYHYLHNDLQIKRDIPYEIITDDVRPWNYDRFINGYANALGALGEAMTKNAHMRVFVASGYLDLATPFFGSEYTFDHLGLSSEVHKNITMEYYDAGHMMYVHEPSLKKLKKDLTLFYQQSINRQQ
jgi:carboxypeptidase C (cathepsin A)